MDEWECVKTEQCQSRGVRVLGESWRQWKEGTGFHADAVLKQLPIRRMDWDEERVLS